MPLENDSRIRSLDLIDMQAGGDVSRVVIGGVAPLPGASVLEQMRFLEGHGDGLRRLLLNEPYGDPAMSVDLVLPASNPKAQAGYIIMEAMGYPLYSGSNTMCTATAILQSGLIPIESDGTQEIVLESPAGLAHISAECLNGRVESVTCRCEPAFVAARGLTVDVPGYGAVPYDVVWSGAFFAMVEAEPLGFELVWDENIALTAFGDAFIRAARKEFSQDHPQLGRVGPLPFVHFMGPLEEVGSDGYRSRSATYVHPGVICRSPTGTGTSARLAQMADRGTLHEGQWLETISPRNSRFTGLALDTAPVGSHTGLNSTITGRAWTLARSKIVIDLDDPLVIDDGLSRVLSPNPL